MKKQLLLFLGLSSMAFAEEIETCLYTHWKEKASGKAVSLVNIREIMKECSDLSELKAESKIWFLELIAEENNGKPIACKLEDYSMRISASRFSVEARNRIVNPFVEKSFRVMAAVLAAANAQRALGEVEN